MAQPLLEVEDLRVTFGANGHASEVVSGVSFSVYRGEVLTPHDTFPGRPSPDGHDDHANPTQKNVAIKRFRDHSIRRGILSVSALYHLIL